MKSFSFLLLLLVLSASVCAVEPTDLGQGLAYLRINSLTKSAQDLRSALLRPGALVLDLRYTVDEPGAADALRELNSQPAKPTLYVLVSPATPKSVADIVAITPARRVTLGIKDSAPAPDVTVGQSAADDRRAYDALESGTTLAQLISGKIEKERFDEASLVQEFKNGNHEAKPPAVPALRSPGSEAGGKADGSAAPAATGAPAAPAPPVDRVLQRAVHLHQALQALKHG